MMWLVILGFAVSSSIDNLGVGLSYGVKDIRIGIFANLLISLICFIFSEIGIVFGLWLSHTLPGIFPPLVASFLLLVIGLRIILLANPRKNQQREIHLQQEKDPKKTLIRILNHPEIIDLDESQEIGFGEASLLGIALSANALTNGLSAGLLGLSPLLISLTSAIASFFTIQVGVKLGKKMTHIRIGSFTLGEFGTLISAFILIIIALKTFLF